MKTTKILTDKTPRLLIQRLIALNPIKRLRAIAASALLAVGATMHADAQTVYSVNIVGCVPPMTTYLLTAPLTIEQRQVLHAQNFNQLASSARPYYLHTVAYALGFAVATGGQAPTSEMLAQHLQTVPSIYQAPAIPPEDSQFVAVNLVVVQTALQELNVRISGQVANNSSFQQAMRAGAVDSFYDSIWDNWDDL